MLPEENTFFLSVITEAFSNEGDEALIKGKY